MSGIVVCDAPVCKKSMGIIPVTTELLCKNAVFFISIIFGLTACGE
jgi:hypothetical protein